MESVTANGLHELRSITHYDGWMKLLSRPGSKKEILMANVNEVHLAVFSCQELNDDFEKFKDFH